MEITRQEEKCLRFQGKGGVGKTVVASYFYQILRERGVNVIGVDMDPVNKTFASYTDLKVEKYEVLGKDRTVDMNKFDPLTDWLIKLEKDPHIILDTGSSSYLQYLVFLASRSGMSTLQDMGMKVFVHTVIAGGPMFFDCMTNLGIMLSTFEAADISIPVVIWRNEFAGELSFRGTGIDDSPLLQKHADKIYAHITIPWDAQKGVQEPVQEMITNKYTFSQYTREKACLSVQSRMRRYFNDLCEQVDRAKLVE